MYDLSLLYGPMYGNVGFGVNATVTLPGTDGETLELTVIDKTAGVDSIVGGGRFHADVQTVAPAAIVRTADLASIDRERLHGAEIAFNGKTWKIDTHGFRPSPTGEADGEILLFLTDR